MKPFFIGFDIETGGEKAEYALQPWRVTSGQAWVTSFAAVDENGCIIDRALNPSLDQLRAVLEKIAEDPCAICIGWRTDFDVAWMIALGLEDVVRKIRWMDGIVMRRGFENSTEHSGWGLKATVRKYLPEYTGYEEEVGGNFQEVSETLLQYNTLDSQLTAKLGRLFWDKLEDKPRMLVQVICQCIPDVARSWFDGVTMNRKALAAWSIECRRMAEEAINETDIDPKIMRSPKKLLEVLTDRGFEIVSTDKASLSLHADDPNIAAVRKFKRATSSESRYIQNSIKCMDYNGGDTVHSAPSIWGTYTGRFTYSSKQKAQRPAKKQSHKMVNAQLQVGVALHQWPKKREGKIARRCIVPPLGYLLAEYDFSNQESRVLADISGDRTMLSVFNEGKDYHCIMGAKAARMDYEEFVKWYKTGDKAAETFRQMGKVANLSLAYRTGAQTFQTMARTDYDVILTFDEATMLCRLFKQTYPGVVQFWDRAISFARAQGYAETMGGRRVYLDKWQRGNGGYASEQTAINFPVQGTGADMKFLGLALVSPMLQKTQSRYMLDLHDALFVLIPDNNQAMTNARAIHHVLNNLPYEKVFGWSPKVPMIVDGKIGTSWGDLEEIK